MGPAPSGASASSPMLGWQTLLLANAAVAAGAAIQGTVGFGMNLIALPLLFALDERFVPVPLLIAHPWDEGRILLCGVVCHNPAAWPSFCWGDHSFVISTQQHK